jgi:amino acid adenylation domain-containing protein
MSAPAPLPLGIAQYEVLQDQRLWPGSPHLLVGGCGVLHGPVDVELLRLALAELIAEQPVLRMIPSLSGQRLLAHLEPPLLLLPAPQGLAPLDALEAVWRDWTRTAPELGDAAHLPPWRVALLKFDPELHGFVLWAHHSLLDGYGTALFAQRWALLASRRQRGEPPLPADGQAFLRHLENDAAYPGSPAYQADAAFWAAELPQAPPSLFPQPPRSRLGLPDALLSTQWLPRAEYAQWQQLARLEGQGEFASLTAALAWHSAALLQRDEVVIGVPTLNRHGKAERSCLGMFVSVLPLRLQMTETDTPRTLVAQVGRQMRRAMRHARFPASHLARQLQLAQSGRERLFDLLLSFERQDYSLSFGEARLTASRQLFSGKARFPLSLTLCDFGPDRELALVAEGSSALFDSRSLELLLRRLRWLSQQMLAQPDAPLRSLPLLPPAEREAVLEGMHRDCASQALAPSFVARFAEQAALHPESVALVWDGGQLSYGHLAEAAWALAARLVAEGLAPGQPVALLLPRGAPLVVALLAVARAGGAFVPLDPEAPPARLQAMLHKLQAPLLLVEWPWGLHERELNVQDRAVAKVPLPDLPDESQPAYALFTSGSTGEPKAVQVSHGALARRFAWLAKVWDLTPQDRSLQGTQPGFDPALLELLLPLTLGASVALTPAGRQSPERWAAFALRHGCSFSALVPSTLARLLDGIEALPATDRERLRLRVVCSGGELLPPSLAQRWLRCTRVQLWNVYGPTEACIFATAWACRDADLDGSPDQPVPLGTPLDDTRLYVLSPALQPLPFGTPGDIWLGGATLADGYLNDPLRSHAAFNDDPFVAGGRIYRTGDRGLIDGEGRLQFLGRSDRQLKLRGIRVEPAEIELQLLALAGVQEACVQPHVGPGGAVQLHAWLAPETLDLASLQKAARERLSEVMLPNNWMLLPALPRSSTGKLLVEQLPPPVPSPGAAHRGATRPLEQQLLNLMARALNRPVDALGIDDDFFQIGGDSLAALDWLTSIETATGRSLGLGQLGSKPTVAALAALLAPNAVGLPSGKGVIAIPLTGAAGRPTLYLAASGHGDLLRFQTLAQALAEHCNVQMLQPPTPLPEGGPAALAALYGAHIRAQQPAAVLLAGFSVGGVAALETARWLQQQGQAVQSLVLIDSVFPRWLVRQPWLWRLLGWLTRSLYVQELSMNGRRLGAMFKDAGLVGQVLALKGYRLLPYSEPVQLIRTTGLARWQGWLFGPWRKAVKLQELEVQGLHGSVFEAGRVGALAQCLRQLLAIDT